ncbi:efflux RND transporter periplasmic adaptor subunit [Roseibium salinum]|uniref:Efflux RND transporter periplasmic adaptor subunit n=1 Tax=Roseibium salinum TaxID=1604349 RepID=A0ABT3R2T0_9HYPH|nr:efflux RND transporter periplasmic adaptor subunit [Roseibium sp. DSM 29163]MCX2723499.1 efflux RND transporter periplasmic adaptor subunit [Roseibium sp. DSM 29163]MDN3718628.1 efflux RND transporter periplasmic adaptor subunit [Roseibium salinum]
MSLWKQFVLTLVAVAVAAGLWVRYYPGAGTLLAQWGVDWLPISVANVSPQDAGRPGGGRGGPQATVVTTPVVDITINDRLSAIGTSTALQSVAVTPFTSGRMTEVLVKSGATVKAGDIIARLDADAEQIAVERASNALKDAEARLQRMQALRKTNTATTVQVTDAELAVDNARLQLREAELALSRRSVETPIGGIVGILPITAGNYVSPQTVIATIDDRSEILVDFWVPERYASSIKVGSPLTASSVARPGETFEGVISAVDNRVDSDSRTLQVRARFANDADKLRAGMSFQVSMTFPGDHYPGVDPLAVQWGSDGAFVWAVREGRGVRVPVNIIQRNTDSVLVDAELTPEDEVVTEGIHLVRHGADVAVAGRKQAPASDEPLKTSSTGSGS